MFSCGITEPGIDASASSRSSTSAVRIEVSWRHVHRASSRVVRSLGQRGRLAVVGGPLPGRLEVGHTGTVNPWTTCSWSHCTMRSHQPVTSRMPTRIIITPPRRTTSIWWRRITANAPSMRR